MKCLHINLHISLRLTIWGLPNIGRQCCLVQGSTVQDQGPIGANTSEIFDIVLVRAEILNLFCPSPVRALKVVAGSVLGLKLFNRPVPDSLILTGLSSLDPWFVILGRTSHCTAKFIIWINMWYVVTFVIILGDIQNIISCGAGGGLCWERCASRSVGKWKASLHFSSVVI